MAIPVRVPEIQIQSETITIGDWLVDSGQPVEAGDHLVELILSGIVYVVSSEVSGELEGIVERRGKTVDCGDVIAWMRESEREPFSEEDDPSDQSGDLE